MRPHLSLDANLEPNALAPAAAASPLLDAEHGAWPLPSEAWEALGDERAALADEDVLPTNLDVFAAATLAYGAHPKIHALRERALAELVGFDPRCIDRLPLYAAGAYHGQTLYQTSVQTNRVLTTLCARARELRATLRSDLGPLVRRGLVDGRWRTHFDGGKGYSVVAADLALLVAVAREHWKDVKGRTTLDLGELDEAERLVAQVVVSLGQRHERPAELIRSADDRARAVTLLLRAYDDARRVVSHLRWKEGDADRIAPSLFGGRGRNRRRRRAPSQPTSPSIALGASPSDEPNRHPPTASPASN